MSKESRFKIENKGMFASLLFYAIVGIVCFAILPMTNFPPHIGLIGIFSLLTAYGLFRKRSWAIWFTVTLLFAALTLSLYTLYFIIWTNVLISVIMIAYLVLALIFTAYTVTKRNSLET